MQRITNCAALRGGFRRTKHRASRCGAGALRILSTKPGEEPLLFTPGPLTTSMTTKEAMLVDLGSRDPRFLSVVKDIRSSLLELGGVSQQEGYECVLMQGSGTFGVESVLSSSVPRDDGGLLIVSNGAYGYRMAKIARANRATSAMISKPETSTFTLDDVRNGMKQLSADIKRPVSHVAVVHHETTTGCLNRLDGLRQAIDETADEIGATKPVRLIVDSMSAFGAQPVNMKELGIDFLVSSSNKCIEGVPGFSFALANKEALLEQGDDNARSLALDLRAQWEGLENNGQFRFTPPTHALLAFSSALGQLKAEGGPEARLARYQSNFDVLVDGLGRLGFNPLLEKSIQGPFIATFLVPDDPSWDFSTFYEELAARGLVIYPGKLTQSDCFRIGCIGQLQNDDMRTLVGAVEEVLEGMGVAMPVKQVALA